MSQLLSSGLLAASMLLGQTSEPPLGGGKSAVPAPPTMQPTQPAQRPVLGWLNRDDRPIVSKIQGWFKRDQPEATPTPPMRGATTTRETQAPPILNQPAAPVPTPVPAPAPAPADFPRKLPNPSSQKKTTIEPVAKATTAPANVQQVSVEQSAALPTSKSPILARNVNRIGRDPKFEWITGQIEIENGSLVMYYATPETIDKYNGRILLTAQQADLKQFSRGDLVSVGGQVAQQKTAQGMVPVYRVSHASLIESAKR